jgi:C4-dicarboxylate-specific signal transduction histidine kinase
MELTVEIIFISLLICALGFSCFFLWKEKQKTKLFSERIAEFTGTRDNDLFGKGKFSELGLMSAGIAHEISNPLTVINGKVNQLLRIYRDPQKQKDLADGLQKILYSSERIEKIVRGMRHYIYRDDEISEESISLQEIIDTVLLFCGQRLKNHGIEFRTINVDNVFVKGHRGQLEQALLNLINNSFDAVDELQEKWIEVTAVSEGEVVDIYVKDSGHGIPMDIEKQMLEPFFTTKHKKGTGLGLPLVKGIAEKHGGDLVYIEKAANTTFMLELPKATSISLLS